jgi:hypothetical protein
MPTEEAACSTPTDRSDWTISLHENGTADGAIVVVDTLNGALGRYAVPNAGPNDEVSLLGWGTGGQ